MLKTLLIVDDSDVLRQLLANILRDAGYLVLEAKDGKDALAQMDGRKIHLIICDFYMPEMDGIAFVKLAKQLPNYKFTPVIMLSSEFSETVKAAGRQAGINTWLPKPVQPAQVLAEVNKTVVI